MSLPKNGRAGTSVKRPEAVKPGVTRLGMLRVLHDIAELKREKIRQKELVRIHMYDIPRTSTDMKMIGNKQMDTTP